MSVLERPNDLGFDGNSGEGSWEVADPRPIDPASKTARDLLLHAIASGLSRDERLMLTLYYCEELTMMEVGAVLDMSESRISQMHSALLKRLRVQLVCEHEYRRPGARPSLADKGRRARRPALVPAGAAA